MTRTLKAEFQVKAWECLWLTVCKARRKPCIIRDGSWPGDRVRDQGPSRRCKGRTQQHSPSSPGCGKRIFVSVNKWRSPLQEVRIHITTSCTFWEHSSYDFLEWTCDARKKQMKSYFTSLCSEATFSATPSLVTVFKFAHTHILLLLSTHCLLVLYSVNYRFIG